MNEPWSYQQYDPATRTFFPVTEEDEPVTLYEPGPDEDPVDVWAEVFQARDARRRRCQIVAVPRC